MNKLFRPILSFAVTCCSLVLSSSVTATDFDQSPLDHQSAENETPKQDTSALKSENGNRIVKGVMRNDTLWLLIENQIASYDVASEEFKIDTLQQSVVDIAIDSGGALYLLTFVEHPRSFQILRRGNVEHWDTVATYLIEDDHDTTSLEEFPLALCLRPNSLCGVLTTKAVYVGDLRNLNRHEVTMGELYFSLQPSFVVMNDRFAYWGRNLGEWGGGLVRWLGGDPYLVERRDSSGLCDGPLNSNCDPVTAVLPDAERPECLIVAVGLRHLLEHGRVLRVCGDDVHVLYEGDCSDSVPINTSDGSRYIPCTEAIFGLASVPDGFLAVTGKNVVQFDHGGVPRHIYQRPTLVKKSGLWLSTEVPDVIIVGTSSPWTVSSRSYLLIPRQ